MKTKRLMPVLMAASLLSSLNARAETCSELMDQIRRLTETHLPREQNVDALKARTEALKELDRRLEANNCITSKKRPQAGQ